MSKEQHDCHYYDQCLGFQDDSTVTALAIGILLVDIFLFIASIWHRQSNLEHLLFITSRYYLYFYFVCLLNFLVIIISVTFFNYTATYSQISVGVTLILTATSTMLINVIGCKYYRSYLCMKKLSLRALVFMGISTLIIFTVIGSSLLYLTVFDKRQNVQIIFEWFLFFELLVTVIHTSIASLASKLAQVEWILLMIFTALYVESYFNPKYNPNPFNLFLIYWHPILLCCISVATVFGLSPFSKLRGIAMGIFSCFIAMFDLVTDINVIYVWITKQHYIWAMWQTLFILTGVIFSGVYIKNYYGFRTETDQDEASHIGQKSVDTDTLERATHKSQASIHSNSTYSEYIPSQRVQTVGQICTFIGLGRLWHGFLGWDSVKNKDMQISDRILKVWEMIFESMPTLVLQFYILLLSEDAYDLSVMLSISASGASVTFTLLRVLYGDHHSMTRKQDLNVGLLKLKSFRTLEEFGKLRFSHRNVLTLTMMGHSPARIDRAWSAIKKSDEHMYMNQDDPEFENIMVEELDKIAEEDVLEEEEEEYEISEEKQQRPSHTSMSAPMPIINIHKIPLKIPSMPSMNAPMISVTVNGQQQQQQRPANIGMVNVHNNAYTQSQPPANINVHNNAYRQQQAIPANIGYFPQQQQPIQTNTAYFPPQNARVMYGQPMYNQPAISTHTSVPMYNTHAPQRSQPHLAAVNTPSVAMRADSEPISVQLASPSDYSPQQEYEDSEFGGATSVMSDTSYREKKNRVNWTHPYIIHLKDLGWSKSQIQSAYFVLKNNTDNSEAKERSKLKEDDDKFLAFMIHILVEELKYKPEHEQRQFSDSSECIDNLYQNFVCCLCCRLLTKINDDNVCCCGCCCCFKYKNRDDDKVANKSTDLSRKDNMFYFAMYIFVMTDFYCRVFPLLAYMVLLREYLESLTSNTILNVAIGTAPLGLVIGAYELLSYYMMLNPRHQSFTSAIKYFWTGTYTVSYYYLSTMQLTYLPSNVDFSKLYRAHAVRMCIQLLIMFVAIGMQYTLFKDPLGFFHNSVYFFGVNWIMNVAILFSMKCYMNTFVNKIGNTATV